MNCHEVREQLSEYLEQSLDDATMKSVETHLSSCLPCRNEAHSLLLCIQNVARLPIVEPPIGFTQRVMAHIRDLETKRSLWERLWFPLRIKVPIHATAIMLIGILAVYLLEREDSQRHSLTTSGQVASLSEKKRSGEPAVPASSSETKQPPPAALAPLPGGISSLKDKSGTSESPASKEKKEPSSSSREMAAPAQSPSKAGTEVVEAEPLFEAGRGANLRSLLPIDPRGRARGVISGTPVVNPATPRIGTGPFSLPSELETDSARVGPPSLLPLADYELVVRRRPAQHDQTASAARKRSEAVAERQQTASGGIERLIAIIADSTRPQTIWVSLAANQLAQFKRDLASLGTIESESATSIRDLDFATKTESEIILKLTVLPPSEANRETATVPSGR